MKAFAAIVTVLCAFLISASTARAQVWAQTSLDTNQGWNIGFSSADGTKLIAEGNGIYYSTNSGQSWYPNNGPTTSSGIIACSADEKKLVAVQSDSPYNLYTSTNFGVTWTPVGDPLQGDYVQSIACSANAHTLVALAGGPSGGIFVSTNFAANWTMATNPNVFWGSVVCSADGTKMAAQNAGLNGVYTSTNSGYMWQKSGISSRDYATANIISSADGSKLVVSAGLHLYISTNWGTTWSFTNNALGGYIVSSADCSLLLNAGYNNVNGTPFFDIYTSTNLGVSWVSNNLPQQAWNSVACSADGKELIAGAGTFGQNDNPATNGVWIAQMTPSPQLNLSSSKTNLNFSWLVPSTNMVLQQSPDLNAWTTITNSPALNYTNLQEQLTLSSAGSPSFFRLISQ